LNVTVREEYHNPSASYLFFFRNDADGTVSFKKSIINFGEIFYLVCNLAASKISSFLREVLSITFSSNAPFFIIWIPEPSSKPASFLDFDVAKERNAWQAIKKAMVKIVESK